MKKVELNPSQLIPYYLDSSSVMSLLSLLPGYVILSNTRQLFLTKGDLWIGGN